MASKQWIGLCWGFYFGDSAQPRRRTMCGVIGVGCIGLCGSRWVSQTGEDHALIGVIEKSARSLVKCVARDVRGRPLIESIRSITPAFQPQSRQNSCVPVDRLIARIVGADVL